MAAFYTPTKRKIPMTQMAWSTSEWPAAARPFITPQRKLLIALFVLSALVAGCIGQDRETQARKQFNEATTMLMDGHEDKARQAYRRLAADYPETEMATRANDRLMELDKQDVHADLAKALLPSLVKALKEDDRQVAVEAAEARTKNEAEAALQARRKAELDRLARIAGGGPSGSYASAIRNAVRPNITFEGTVPDNHFAEVEVRLDSSGRIVSTKLVKSSGVKGWDDAVLKALERTGTLPSDNGRYWNPIVMAFRPSD